MDKLILAWSGGKDSAMAAHALRRRGQYQIAALLTTVTEDYDRVSMHGVRRALAEEQARRMGVDLEIVLISAGAGNSQYEERMRTVLEKYLAIGVRHAGFGDLYLEDVRQYRLANLAKVGMSGVFPLWGLNTGELARQFIDQGFRAILTCVDTQKLDARFAGREFDRQLLEDLPQGVDPCGENGEFHSFVYAGPIFAGPLSVRRGEIVLREGRFNYCDVLPA